MFLRGTSMQYLHKRPLSANPSDKVAPFVLRGWQDRKVGADDTTRRSWHAPIVPLQLTSRCWVKEVTNRRAVAVCLFPTEIGRPGHHGHRPSLGEILHQNLHCVRCPPPLATSMVVHVVWHQIRVPHNFRKCTQTRILVTASGIVKCLHEFQNSLFLNRVISASRHHLERLYQREVPARFVVGLLVKPPASHGATGDLPRLAVHLLREGPN
mmetsp:Transcript_48728/g.129182  ORF Transcript_48728/g.129182 Transcript_48728/m.129182 type:complete len:211 (-) Transcript_48728:993-1625(-)